MTDSIADLLTRIRNAITARHRTVQVPLSKLSLSIVKILADEGYVDGFESNDEGPQGTITVSLKYVGNGTPGITGLERVSTPGRRIYRGKDDIPRVLNGLGITILSTSRGVMTGSSCRRLGVGGEVLCNVW